MAPALLTSFLCCDHKTIFRPTICCLIGYLSQTGLNCWSDLFISSSSAPQLYFTSSPRPFLGSLTWHHTPATTRLPTMNLPLSLSKCQPCWNGPCSLCQPRSNCRVGPNVAKKQCWLRWNSALHFSRLMTAWHVWSHRLGAKRWAC